MAPQTSINIPYIAIGRVTDACVLATNSKLASEQHTKSTTDIFKRLMGAAAVKLKPNQKQRLQWDKGSMCCILDNTGTVLVALVTSEMEYPERTAMQCLKELLRHIADNFSGVPTAALAPLAWDPELNPYMGELLEKYENPQKVDRINQTQKRLDNATNVMRDNVRKAYDTGEQLQQVEEQSEELAHSSKHFNAQSRQLKNKVWWQNKKLIGAIVGGVVIIGGGGLAIKIATRDKPNVVILKQDTRTDENKDDEPKDNPKGDKTVPSTEVV